MNRPLVLTGVALGAAVALTGCGGGKKAATVAQGPWGSAGARQHSPAAPRPPAATATAAGTVRVGGYCKATGTVGKTKNGGRGPGQKRPGGTPPRRHSPGP